MRLPRPVFLILPLIWLPNVPRNSAREYESTLSLPVSSLPNKNRSLLTNPDGSYTERGRDVIRQTPFGRMGEPEELCGTIHYLMSKASKFVTGTVAVVDGGFNVFAM